MKIISTWLMLSLSLALAFSADINRKTFSISTPDKWTEDTNDDMYSPDAFIFFNGPESCLFTVIIGKESAGASVEKLVNNQRDVFLKRFTSPTVTKITKWSKYDGQGFKIEGKSQGIVKASITIFGFQKGDNVCLIEEYATLGDFKTYQGDFEKFRQTFKLK